MGEIVTFYSYKGGVGRTMALANMAILLATWGYKILMVDWDLEAPGLEFYFKDYLDLEDVAQSRGVIDLLYSGLSKQIDWRDFYNEINLENLDISEVATAEEVIELVTSVTDDSSSYSSETIKWQDLFLEIQLPDSSIPLHMITVGNRDNDYFGKVRGLDLQSFYSKHEGGFFIESLREEWKREYDFVLIDSRTGITDLGGICTVQLPDILVLFFNATEQSFKGIVDIAKNANLAQHQLPFDRLSLLALPVPSRFDSAEEFKISQEWLNRFAEGLVDVYAYWLPTTINKRDFLEVTKIPYGAYFSFGERLPVLEQGTLDPQGLGYAYETLTALVAHRLESVELLLEDRSRFIKSAVKEGGIREAYMTPATSDKPAHIIFLLKSSGSMSNVVDGKQCIKWLEDALASVLDSMLDRSMGQVYRPRYKIAVLTYSNDVYSLTNGDFVDVLEFWNAGLPTIAPNGANNIRAAFEQVYEIILKLLKDPRVQYDCPAPVICHITDGGKYNTGGSPLPIVNKIQQLKNQDGSVLIQNWIVSDKFYIHPIETVYSWHGFSRSDIKEDAYWLYQISSYLPDSYASIMADDGFKVTPNSKMLYPLNTTGAIELLKVSFASPTSTAFR